MNNEIELQRIQHQEKVFAAGESDAWYRRNAAILNEERATSIAGWVELFGIHPKKILDIGCSNGYILKALTQKFHAQGFGVELSREAVEDGQSRYPELTLRCGAAGDLDHLADQSVDLIFINGVFHWIDRPLLLKTCAQMDRVLADGGYLMIGDFHPDFPVKNPYHHRSNEDVWTYKQDHAGIFLATGFYKLCHKLSFDHSSLAKPKPDAGFSERWSIQLARKDLSSLVNQTLLE